jgi:hypothetical protein
MARILFSGDFRRQKEKQRATELARDGLDTSFFRAELAARFVRDRAPADRTSW